MICSFDKPLGLGWQFFFAFLFFSFLRKLADIQQSLFTRLSVQYVIMVFTSCEACHEHFTSMYCFEESYIQENANNVPNDLL